MSSPNGFIEFETPAARVIKQFSDTGKEPFRIPVDLPDLAILRQLSIQGRLRFNIATNSTLTLTPTIGETQFIYKVYLNATSAFSNFTITNDGMNRVKIRLAAATSLVVDFFDSLVGNSIKTFTVTASGAGTEITALSWIENTSRIRDVAI